MSCQSWSRATLNLILVHNALPINQSDARHRIVQADPASQLARTLRPGIWIQHLCLIWSVNRICTGHLSSRHAWDDHQLEIATALRFSQTGFSMVGGGRGEHLDPPCIRRLIGKQITNFSCEPFCQPIDYERRKACRVNQPTPKLRRENAVLREISRIVPGYQPQA